MDPLVKLEKWALLFVTAAELSDKPASCGLCTMMLAKQKRCIILGPDIIIESVTKDGKTYTPGCSQQDPGDPIWTDGPITYLSKLLGSEKADMIGLEWSEGAGTNCGGVNGGAACTKHFDPETNGCRPLQDTVAPGDCCAAHNGPAMDWREAQLELRK